MSFGLGLEYSGRNRDDLVSRLGDLLGFWMDSRVLSLEISCLSLSLSHYKINTKKVCPFLFLYFVFFSFFFPTFGYDDVYLAILASHIEGIFRCA